MSGTASSSPSNDATPLVIIHIDDLGASHGANIAMTELAAAGVVTSGSVIVPAPWFPEIARLDHPSLDLGVHLALTSESAAFRWRPISTTSRASGLFDADGYLWPDTPSVRANAHLDAVETELRAQVEAARAAGINVTHLDHHMGAALAPEFAAATARLAKDHDLPVLFPRAIAGYVGVLTMGEVDVAILENVRAELDADGLAIGEEFLMGLAYQDEPCREVYERFFKQLQPGVTFLSLHCSEPGEIEQIHPGDFAWRVAEYDLFRDVEFTDWLAQQRVRLIGFREIRDSLRTG